LQKATITQISSSSSSPIVCMTSGATQFQPDFKNCYLVHP